MDLPAVSALLVDSAAVSPIYLLHRLLEYLDDVQSSKEVEHVFDGNCHIGKRTNRSVELSSNGKA